jgi:hypothetical protein
MHDDVPDDIHMYMHRRHYMRMCACHAMLGADYSLLELERRC